MEFCGSSSQSRRQLHDHLLNGQAAHGQGTPAYGFDPIHLPSTRFGGPFAQSGDAILQASESRAGIGVIFETTPRFSLVFSPLTASH
jgi:hypothetical protein